MELPLGRYIKEMKVTKILSKTTSILLALTLLGASPVYALPIEPIDPLLPILLEPLAPTNLEGSFNADGDIVISWQDKSNNETNFEIAMQGPSGGGIVTVGTNITSYTESTTHYLGESYQFKVRAINSYGESAWSNTITLIPAKPAAPTGITAAFEADGDVLVKWKDNATNETSYEILMEDGSSGGSLPLAANATSYTDTYTHVIGYSYTYSVRAKNAFGVSAWSSEVSVSPAIPSVPSNVTVTLESDNSTRVFWIDNSNNESGFEIKVTSSGGGNNYSVGENKTTYHNTMVHTPGTTYSYSMRAVNAFGTSNWTIGTPLSVPAIILVGPTAPSNLTAVVNSSGDIVLEWNDNSNNESGFDISISQGSISTTESVGAGVETYTFSTAVDGETYTFKVRSKNFVGNSAWTNSASVLIEEGEIPQSGSIFDGTQSSWAQDELQEAHDYGLTYPTVMNHFTQQITREEFCTIVVKLYEKLTGNSATSGEDPFTDTSNSEILKAYNLGIVKGKSADQFVPNANITREEICVMIMRCLDVADPNLDKSLGSGFNFDDANQIDAWADTAMRFCFKNDIMKGIGGGKIAPLQNTQRQEAIVLLKRTFEKFD